MPIWQTHNMVSGGYRRKRAARRPRVTRVLMALLLSLASYGVAAPAASLLTLALADCDDVTVAPRGDLYLACHSPSDKFTVPVIGQKAANDEMDGYVIRLRTNTNEIVYVTRLGGGAYDLASRVAVDAHGNAWVAGYTKSADFAVTGDAWQKTFGGDGDAFLVKLSPEGRVLFSTFIGGPRNDFGNAIALVDGEPVIGGTSDGNGFVQRGPSRRVTFGGSGEEKLTGIAYHAGKIYTAGYTQSKDWKRLRGPSDAFVVRLDAKTLAVEHEEFYGGIGDDSAWGIAVDKRGRVFIAGKPVRPIYRAGGAGFRRRITGQRMRSLPESAGLRRTSVARGRTRPATTGRTSRSMRRAMCGSPE